METLTPTQHITPDQSKNFIIDTYNLKVTLLHQGFYDEINITSYLIPLFQNSVYKPTPIDIRCAYNNTKFNIYVKFDDKDISKYWGSLCNNNLYNTYFDQLMYKYASTLMNNGIITLTKEQSLYLSKMTFSFYTLLRLSENIIQIQL